MSARLKKESILLFVADPARLQADLAKLGEIFKGAVIETTKSFSEMCGKLSSGKFDAVLCDLKTYDYEKRQTIEEEARRTFMQISASVPNRPKIIVSGVTRADYTQFHGGVDGIVLDMMNLTRIVYQGFTKAGSAMLRKF